MYRFPNARERVSTYKFRIDLRIGYEIARDVEPNGISVRLVREELDKVATVCFKARSDD